MLRVYGSEIQELKRKEGDSNRTEDIRWMCGTLMKDGLAGAQVLDGNLECKSGLECITIEMRRFEQMEGMDRGSGLKSER